MIEGTQYPSDEERIYDKVRDMVTAHTRSFLQQQQPARDPQLIKNYMNQIVGIKYSRQIEDYAMAAFHHEAWATDIKEAYPQVLFEVTQVMPDTIAQPNLDLGPERFEPLKKWLVDRYIDLTDGVGPIGSQLEKIEDDSEASVEKLVLVRERASGKAEGVAFIAVIGFRLDVTIHTDAGTKPLKDTPREYQLTGNVRLRRYELGPEHPEVIMQEMFFYSWKDKP